MAAANWSGLQTALFELILMRLPLVDLLRIKAVCSSWNLASISYISSPFQAPILSKTPWIMLHIDKQDNPNTRRFFNLVENKYYKITNKAFEELHKYYCVGSSQGWLMFLDKNNNNNNPHLLNPFSGTKIQLPSPENLITLNKFKFCISKTMQLNDPCGSKGFSVVITYGPGSLAFFNLGDNKWTNLYDHGDRDYNHILNHNGMLYALSSFKGQLEAWDFHHDCDDHFPMKVLDLDFTSMLLPSNGYLMESMGELLYVAHVIGNYNAFVIYKMDFGRKIWVAMETLCDNRTLFVGEKESVSICTRNFPELGKKLIYTVFIRGNIKAYNFKNKKVAGCIMVDVNNNLNWPLPFWIVPNPRLMMY